MLESYLGYFLVVVGVLGDQATTLIALKIKEKQCGSFEKALEIERNPIVKYFYRKGWVVGFLTSSVAFSLVSVVVSFILQPFTPYDVPFFFFGVLVYVVLHNLSSVIFPLLTKTKENLAKPLTASFVILIALMITFYFSIPKSNEIIFGFFVGLIVLQLTYRYPLKW